MNRQALQPVQSQITHLEFSKSNETCSIDRGVPPESVQTICSQHTHHIMKYITFHHCLLCIRESSVTPHNSRKFESCLASLGQIALSGKA